MTRTTTAIPDPAAITADPRGLGQQAVRHVWHHITQVAEYADVGPLMLVEGQGALLRDIHGREYIDGTAIMGVTMIGHGREEVAEAMAAQARRLEYASLANGFSNVPATQLARKLADLTPGALEVSYFACSGSEAVETAIKMARHCQARRGFRGRTKIIARRGSYHGVTLGALSATGLTGFREPFEPLLPGFVHIAQPYVYRAETEVGCPPAEVGVQAARALERQILFEGPETVAAFIAEPVAIPQAIKVPPPDYWPLVQEICRKYGVLLIVDEVFCGFGRTGKLFGSEHWKVEPDIMTMSKGLTSGYVPLSAAIATQEVFQAFWGRAKDAFQHGGTYSGHPVSCATALANLAILERERLVENADVMGRRLLAGLRELADHPFVGDVSGIGLLLSLELVADKRTKAPAPSAVGRFLRDRMQELGLLARYTPETLYLFPPLVLTADQVDRILQIFREAFAEAAARFGGALKMGAEGMRVAVVGAGNAGYAVAADLALGGAQVTLAELPRFADTLAPLREQGRIRLVNRRLDGTGQAGEAQVAQLTTELGEAAAQADVILVTTQTGAHEEVARLVAPGLHAGHILLFFTGYASTILVRQILEEAGVAPAARVAETVTLPYACRRTGPAEVEIVGKHYAAIRTAALPATDTARVLEQMRPLYPNLIAAANVLETALLNSNVTRHTVGTLLNIGRIEAAQGNFWLYREAFTPAVWRVHAALDAEKMALMAALGIPPRSFWDYRRELSTLTVEDQAACYPAGPSGADTRYLTEDVPMGLVFFASLGECLGVPTPTARALIHLTSLIGQTDYWASGRTLARLGVGELSADALRAYVERGSQPAPAATHPR